MSPITLSLKTKFLSCLTIMTLITTTGCGNLTPAENIVLWTAVGTAIVASSPAQEIEQIYYLGVFDPQEQVPPMVYRIRVHGQASLISNMKFGSGWVPANLIDSLGTNISFKDSNISIDQESSAKLSSIQTGRRLVLFGPEGFREAPEGYRLVIVMGASPDKFFNAIDRSLGTVSQAIAQQRNEGLSQLLLLALSETKTERIRLDDLEKDVENDLRAQKGGNP